VRFEDVLIEAATGVVEMGGTGGGGDASAAAEEAEADEEGAIMLPYMKGDQYINQYTLVYSDWDVLICDKQGVTKGLPKHCVELFNELMNMC